MREKKQQQSFQYHTEPTSDTTLQTILIEKERLIVPIIFIPGVMGSNLREKTTKSFSKPIWRLDRAMTAIGWSSPYYGNPKSRKLELDPDKTEVDDRGAVIDAAANECAQIEDAFVREIRDFDEDEITKYIDAYNIKQQRIQNVIKNNPETVRFGNRKDRGWGTVSYMTYGEFLKKLQESLFEPEGQMPSALNELIQSPLFSLHEGSKTSLMLGDDQIKHCNNFYFPVHAMGYNWLESNEDSAIALQKLVEVTLPNYYRKRGQSCDKVILITHSMGGLVARYYTQALGGAAKVYGVIHGVHPATGAVTAYTRMKRGTEVNTTFLNKPIDSIKENVLGKDAAEMTAVCAQAPGPLQLLPTQEYGMGWLTITDPDGKVESYPKSDPYDEIYLAKDKWWCACEPHLINPFNTEHDLRQMQDDWDGYEIMLRDKVKTFNQSIANQYHPNTYAFFGLVDAETTIDTKYMTYKKAHWIGRFEQGYQPSMKKPVTDHIGAKNRLELTELNAYRTLAATRHDWVEAHIKTHYGIHHVNRGNIKEIYQLQPADANGDGTVPRCSGEIPITYLQARMHLPLEHEGAYQDEVCHEFTLRAIVDILQQVMVDD